MDLEGNQLCGGKARTSEILMHLQMMQRQPRAAASVHCHPPYSTGFAVAGVAPPTGLVPEFELFVSAAIAPYRTPGTPEMGQLIADLADQHNTILMANHGVVAWSHNNVEDAYFKIEILEAYCRTVLVASQLGKTAPAPSRPPRSRSCSRSSKASASLTRGLASRSANSVIGLAANPNPLFGCAANARR